VTARPTTYLVVRDHTSELPDPITFTAGAPLTVCEEYRGPEGWDTWFFCETPGQTGGWVPAQLIRRIDGTTACALEDYTARELDVHEGETLLSSRTLNGWAWCTRAGSTESGWVPLANLEERPADAP